MELIILFIIILILGALCGGKSFGDTLGKGCGCLIGTIFLILLAVFIFLVTLS